MHPPDQPTLVDSAADGRDDGVDAVDAFLLQLIDGVGLAEGVGFDAAGETDGDFAFAVFGICDGHDGVRFDSIGGIARGVVAQSIS